MTIQNNFRSLLLDKQKREQRKITYTEISLATGSLIKTISQWDNGNITQFKDEVVVRFCHYFGCEIGDLLQLNEAE